jgi:hypothetical protein
MGRMPRAGEEFAEQWWCVRHCLSACRKLGKARILTVQQLRCASGRWLRLDDLRQNHRVLTADEAASLTSWLDAAGLSSGAAMASDDHEPTPTATHSTPPPEQRMTCTAYAGVMPPCVRGSVVPVWLMADGRAELEHLPDADSQEQSIDHISDEDLARYLCQTRAVFPFTVDGRILRDVECLLPLASVAPAAQAEASIVVSIFQVEQSQSPTPLAVMTMALRCWRQGSNDSAMRAADPLCVCH